MQENLVSFQVAKLAKEKGFTLQTNPFGYVTKFYRPSTKTLLSYGRTGRSKINDLIYAPTQSLLQKWLREVHSMHIVPLLESYSGDYGIEILINGKAPTRFYNIGNYEDALEEGIFQALKLIK